MKGKLTNNEFIGCVMRDKVRERVRKRKDKSFCLTRSRNDVSPSFEWNMMNTINGNGFAANAGARLTHAYKLVKMVHLNYYVLQKGVCVCMYIGV